MKWENPTLFKQCIVDLWNLLALNIVMATDLDSFKTHLDKFMKESSVSGF